MLLNSVNSDQLCLVKEDFSKDMEFDCLPIKEFLGRTRAFLKIQDGCQSFCSYCIVPFARGPLRSLESEKVISMLKAFSRVGYKEVVLTGIHLGAYGIDLDDKTDLTCLLHQIGRERLGLRIRLSSIEPNEIDQEIIEMMSSEEWLCRHFHIPLQSGDDEILKRMHRSYSSREFVKLVERIHKEIPLAAIGVDTMAGFPGEDHGAHHNTYALIDDLPISYLHVFPFSPRKGTAAAGFDDRVSDVVIKERAGELRELGKKKREAFYSSCLGKEFSVLSEGWESEEEKMLKGLSDNYLPVIFPSSRLIKNRMISVHLERLVDTRIIGTTTQLSLQE